MNLPVSLLTWFSEINAISDYLFSIKLRQRRQNKWMNPLGYFSVNSFFFFSLFESFFNLVFVLAPLSVRTLVTVTASSSRSNSSKMDRRPLSCPSRLSATLPLRLSDPPWPSRLWGLERWDEILQWSWGWNNYIYLISLWENLIKYFGLVSCVNICVLLK